MKLQFESEAGKWISDSNSHWGFCILYVISPKIQTKYVLGQTVNPTYLIGCCDWNPLKPLVFNLSLPLQLFCFPPIFNTKYLTL